MGNRPEQQEFEFTKAHKRLLLGSVFLMATSAIGPAFLTQTAVFTEQFLASFAFAILISIIIDIGAQINIWRVLVVTGKRGQEVANDVFKGLGTFISALIAIGGLAFNIGNVAGAGLGLNAIFGLDVKWGAALTAIFAILIFTSKRGQKIMDIVTMVLGTLMILIVAFVMVKSNPPYADAAVHTVMPENPGALVLPIITLVGGTVGGYISFAGAHRILDADIKGKFYLPFVNRAAISAILTTGVMRTLLFLAVLGVVATGAVLNPDNPPASVFEHALGPIGKNIFGVVLFAAAMSSVIGSAYTSSTFLKTMHKSLYNRSNLIVIVFIVISTIVFLFIGKPVKLLILAGALNGLILPIVLATVLIASRKKSIVGDYKHPMWMIVFGAIAVLVTVYTGVLSFQSLGDLWSK
ncbi:NRAMP family divalent metal transporter [Staphylococcus massiliensis]|uniref:Branched chain amino acids transporter n=1 Tax=Staphylococcus massiliensis S46 TaxID=1229783 RepID=K9ARP6_9STAP|nr:NRAMP family divalent metal transporter [Staphylococcus massiliensis]EKU49939.1 branched chain amino acids transporter [Staphylococcus massiliensis S46]MCG3399043.1 divalent metal cation transporter [Staphylococcus massiliensis]MCG3400959.1 divalent metal cation transporter [Staphylococcus massiliensis]MCG3412495.1 divalent metal cation transporter [Staphylococcus massiliensis]PNZ98938.1 divalent metal cation transporter [Staphylococcus massiliensis CCUG 55927]